MRCLVFVVTLIVVLVPLCLADTCSMNSADMDGGVRQSMVTYEDLFNATVTGKYQQFDFSSQTTCL